MLTDSDLEFVEPSLQLVDVGLAGAHPEDVLEVPWVKSKLA